jgi:hypothetical protein
MGKGSKPASDHQKAANKATARVRANNAVPDGAQIDHSIKVRGAKEAGMPMDRMNKSLIPLQSNSNKPATTLLTSKDGTSGTTYKVHSGVNPEGEAALQKFDTRQITGAKTPEAQAQAQAQFNTLWDGALNKPEIVDNRGIGNNGKTFKPGGTFHTEHRFSDGYLKDAAARDQGKANPGMNKQDALEAAGAEATFKLKGHLGNVSKAIVKQVSTSIQGVQKVLKANLRVNRPASGAGAKSSPKSSAKPGANLTAKPVPRPSTNAGSNAAPAATSKPQSSKSSVTGAKPAADSLRVRPSAPAAKPAANALPATDKAVSAMHPAARTAGPKPSRATPTPGSLRVSKSGPMIGKPARAAAPGAAASSATPNTTPTAGTAASKPASSGASNAVSSA